MSLGFSLPSCCGLGLSSALLFSEARWAARAAGVVCRAARGSCKNGMASSAPSKRGSGVTSKPSHVSVDASLAGLVDDAALARLGRGGVAPMRSQPASTRLATPALSLRANAAA